jgi:hypothetical protein
MIGAIDSAQPASDTPFKLVGVTPAAAAKARERLLVSLEQVLPVRFQARSPGDVAGLDGLLVLAPPDPQEPATPCARLIAVPQQPGASPRKGCTVQFTGEPQVPRPLRHLRLREEDDALDTPFEPVDGDMILATAEGRPVWWRRQAGAGTVHTSVFSPEELEDAEGLRDHLRIGRCMGLVALLQFLREVCAELDWGEQPLRASFVIDDPNLHWPSYGHIGYPQMVAQASRHGYHVALAMVPLDGWLANRQAVALVKENPAAVSLVMHGNEHVAQELGRLLDDSTAETALAHALRRVAAFERRSGLTVERVMVPPHEVCSTFALNAMFRLGFDGACIGRRNPWNDQLPLPSLRRWTLLKWHPADFVEGLPIIPRYSITLSWEELALRAFLRQPLILFGHHWDFSEGLDLLAEAADYVNGLGDVQWGSVGEIARTSFLARQKEHALTVQMHCRHATIEIPPDVTVLEVRVPSIFDEPARRLDYGAGRITMARERSEWTSGALQVAPGARVELKLVSDAPLNPARVDARRPTPWPLMRRALVEGRDRIRPLTH